jgi:phage shock protein A
MGILDRLMTMIKAKISTFLDRHEDPRETLDYSYEKQLELLTNVKRGIADVVTAKKRLELQKAKLESNIESLNNQAREAVSLGRDDLARIALERKKDSMAQIESLTAQIADLENEQTKLVDTERRLSAKVEAFRTKKETIKAQYSAAEAQVKITESVTGISEEMADVGMSVQRAEEKTESMKARSQALDELIDAGTLQDLTGDQTKVEEELSKIKSSTEVDQELKILKEEATTKKKDKTEETPEAQQ